MSYRLKIDPKSRKVARFISMLQVKIQKALTESGKTQQEVADILGVDRSVVNRRLKGNSNLTARSIAEFAYAFDKNIVLEFVGGEAPQKTNRTVANGNVIRLNPRPESVGSVEPNSTYKIESAAL